jgi:hypothetical protein
MRGFIVGGRSKPGKYIKALRAGGGVPSGERGWELSNEEANLGALSKIRYSTS